MKLNRCFLSGILMLVCITAGASAQMQQGPVAPASDKKIIKCVKNPEVECCRIPLNDRPDEGLVIYNGPADMYPASVYTTPDGCGTNETGSNSIFAFTDIDDPDIGIGYTDSPVCASTDGQTITVWIEADVTRVYTSYAHWRAQFEHLD